jgi:hypothetical protein
MKNLQEAATRLCIKIIHVPGDGDKRAAAYNEVAVRHFTTRLKAGLIETSCPVSYAQEVGDMVEIVSNNLPLSRNVISRTGDCPTVLEVASLGVHSRDDSRHIMHHVVAVGSLAIIAKRKSDTKNSDLASTHNEMGVCIGMKGDCPVWENPLTGSRRMTKNHFVLNLPTGTNWLDHMGLPLLRKNRASRPKQAAAPEPRPIVIDISKVHEIDEKRTRLGDITVGMELYRGAIQPNDTFITLCDAKTGTCVAGDGTTAVSRPEGEDVTTTKIIVDVGRISEGESDKRESKELAVSNPSHFVGAKVWVRFPEMDDGGALEHGGRIVGTWRAGRYWRWEVLYDDGCQEDWNEKELVHYCINGYSTRYGAPGPAHHSVPRDRVDAEGVAIPFHEVDIQGVERHGVGAGDTEDDHVADHALPVGPGVDPYSRVHGKVQCNERRVIRWKMQHVRRRKAPIYETNGRESFISIAVNKYRLSMLQTRAWYNWLGVYFGHNAPPPPPGCLGAKFASPWEGEKNILPTGIKLPAPALPSWQQWLNALERESETEEKIASSMRLARECEQAEIERIFEGQYMQARGAELLGLHDGHEGEPRTMGDLVERQASRAFLVTAQAYEKYMGSRITKEQLTQLTDERGLIKNPKNWKEWQSRPDYKEFSEAEITEMTTIAERHVMTLPMSLAERTKMGIRRMTPVPLMKIWEIKKDPSGAVDKFKCRAVLMGSPRFLKKGRDYWKTYAATPIIATMRIMMFLVVQFGWGRAQGDIKCAYLEAMLKPEERVVVQPAPEDRVFDEVTGEELFPVCEKGLYGHPASGRRFAQEREEYITGVTFNHEKRVRVGAKGGHVVKWTAKKCLYDPCAYVFVREDMHKTTRSIMGAFVDDLDLVWETVIMNAYIWLKMKERFDIKQGNVDHMLGLTREVSADGCSVTIAMAGYIETMYKEFKHLLGEKLNVRAPVPPGTYLTLDGLEPMEKEELKERQELYLRVLGKLLWVTRMIGLEATCSIQMLCRMASNPTDEAIACALQCVKWFFKVKDVGITFRRVSKPGLTVYSDASNKGDPADGDRAQAGYVIFLGEGPLDWRSLRLTHVGLSAQHNEYMALSHACQACRWLQYLLEDFGFSDWVSEPTPMMCDNNAAISLANDDLLTTNNRFYSRLAHYVKECVNEGRVSVRREGTKANLSDGMTKAVDYQTMEAHFAKLRGLEIKDVPPPAEPR